MSTYETNRERALRHDKKRLALGSTSPACVECSESNIIMLRKPKTRRARIRCHNCTAKCARRSASATEARLATFVAAGYDAPTCFVCGESAIATLELHHVAAEANSTLAVPLCMNCHAVQSDGQEDLPVDLRLRDEQRRPLVLQAAFDFGLALLLMVLSVANASRDGEGATAAVFYGLAAVALVAWGVWNLAADAHLAERYGPEYSAAVPAVVPT